MTRRCHIETVGCQMNALDAELVAADLVRAGYEVVEDRRRADVHLFLTCSVRQHAEDKIYSALGRLKHVKERNPRAIVGVLGCMAQKEQGEIFRRAPHVDLVVGPGRLGRLVELLECVTAGGQPKLEVALDGLVPLRRTFDPQGEEKGDSPHLPERPEGCFAQMGTVPFFHSQAMVRAMYGCNRRCTYCIVPSVRGPEQSRPAAEIVEEVRRLTDRGCVEVTLLGQTVNSYKDSGGGRTLRLADLLGLLHDLKGLRRLKFVTNHPVGMTDELLQAVRDLPKVSPYLHVPAQSGSNAVLRRMRRGYTVEAYREMLARIRETVPGAAVTSDFIVGFCGESEADFQATMDLVRDARFKNSFIFKYSARPSTKAAALFPDDVPETVKRRRNNELLALQNAISLEDNQPLVGRTVEILVEGRSKTAKKGNGLPTARGAVQLVGRTVCDRIVVFDGPEELTGRILPVAIERADAFTLYGRALP